MHNTDDKYPPRPGYEPGTPTLQAPVDTNEPSGPADNCFTLSLGPAKMFILPEFVSYIEKRGVLCVGND